MSLLPKFGGKLLLQDAGEPQCHEREGCKGGVVSALGPAGEKVQPDAE